MSPKTIEKKALDVLRMHGPQTSSRLSAMIKVKPDALIAVLTSCRQVRQADGMWEIVR